jgi:hypothetical protein
MKRRLCHVGWLLPLGLLAVVLLGRPWAWSSPSADVDAPAGAVEQPSPASEPAAHLRIRVSDYKGDEPGLLDGNAAYWERVSTTQVLLKRTPRVFQTEPVRHLPIPRLEVRALRKGDRLFLRLLWDDATENAPRAPLAKTGTAGVPAQIYKRPTAHTRTFADALAVMVPEGPPGASFPSLMMGDQHSPAHLYYWNASRGAEELTATGRTTPSRSGKTFPHRSRHAQGKWTLTMEVPTRPAGTPVAFAVWDGEAGDRDGLKWFSVWYVLVAVEKR